MTNEPLDQDTLEAVARILGRAFDLAESVSELDEDALARTILDALPPIPTVADNKGVGRKGG